MKPVAITMAFSQAQITLGSMKRARIYGYAAAMRACPTGAESVLWQALRLWSKHKWCRQRVTAKRYILDFYCAKAKVAIEVDGLYHHSKAQSIKDQRRDWHLEDLGITTLRISNNAVQKDPARVVREADKLCRKRP